MKKVFKFLVAAGAIIGGTAGAVYLLSKKKGDDFGDFDDEDFEDIFADDDDDDRDYVTLDIDSKEKEEEKKEETSETSGAESTADV